ncbi:MAG: adenine deaminase [Clostridiales bacterium]|nr:adenine deaminase [Clostridiales bacterium]
MRKHETYIEKVQRKLEKKQRVIRVAGGYEPADLVLKHATYLNVFSNEFCHGDIAVAEGLIVGMGEYHGKEEIDVSDAIVCPGFIDAHIHLESSLVTPWEFAKAVLPHGTTTVVTDPHDIANVMGLQGIDYMLSATQGLPVDVHFMLPSCVPATPQDESFATLDYKAIDPYFEHPRVLGLAEMMNYVGVIHQQAEPVEKILCSQAHHKKIDGHAPGLSGLALNAYIAAGVYSDHECFTPENALEKLQKGQFIMIREGTAAKNLRALLPLMNQQYYSRLMFATDDKHPSDLLHGGHIDYIVKNAISMGVDPIIAIKVASHNAARYFLMNNKGAIAPGYLADFVIFDNFRNFEIQTVIKKGRVVFQNGCEVEFPAPVVPDTLESAARSTCHLPEINAERLRSDKPLGHLRLIPRELITENLGFADHVDVETDVLKVCVFERHHHTGHFGMGYLSGYGLKRGAVSTSIAHDSHNIIAVGASDADIALAANRVRSLGGGIVVALNGQILAELPLPIAGLMSDKPLPQVNGMLENAKLQARVLGVTPGVDPFMTLSFMSLTVIPTLRVTTQGVFDVEAQQYL